MHSDLFRICIQNSTLIHKIEEINGDTLCVANSWAFSRMFTWPRQRMNISTYNILTGFSIWLITIHDCKHKLLSIHYAAYGRGPLHSWTPTGKPPRQEYFDFDGNCQHPSADESNMRCSAEAGTIYSILIKKSLTRFFFFFIGLEASVLNYLKGIAEGSHR